MALGGILLVENGHLPFGDHLGVSLMDKGIKYPIYMCVMTIPLLAYLDMYHMERFKM